MKDFKGTFKYQKVRKRPFFLPGKAAFASGGGRLSAKIRLYSTRQCDKVYIIMRNFRTLKYKEVMKCTKNFLWETKRSRWAPWLPA